MTVSNQDDRPKPLAAVLDAFRAALVTFADEVAGNDEAAAMAAFERAQQAAEAVLSEPKYLGSGGSASSYDIAVQGNLRLRVRAILDEARAAITARHDQP
jgi:hypothetical protein